jgi:hypothetical protein
MSESFQNWATIFSSLAAAGGLFFTGFQFYRNRKITRADTWLRIREFFTKYDDVHQNLRPGGKWAIGNQGPNTVKERSRVEAYMGLFEHCNIMIDDGLIDLRTFKEIYGYRVWNILNNNTIKTEKLVAKRSAYKNFISLCDKLGYTV